MVSRVWRGWTSSENAAAYERLLVEDIFPGIAARNLGGYRGIQLFRRERENEVEFMTVMWFDSLEAVERFAGREYKRAYVPPAARALLDRFDEYSGHYEVRESLEY